MSIESEFDDLVKICEFYSGDDLPIEVDEENFCITLGGYIVDPVIKGDHFVTFLVEDPDGATLFVSDLDDYFQERLPDWEARF